MTVDCRQIVENENAITYSRIASHCNYSECWICWMLSLLVNPAETIIIIQFESPIPIRTSIFRSFAFTDWNSQCKNHVINRCAFETLCALASFTIFSLVLLLFYRSMKLNPISSNIEDFLDVWPLFVCVCARLCLSFVLHALFHACLSKHIAISYCEHCIYFILNLH